MLRTAPTASPAKNVPASADLMAHRQGSVLILSERLGALTSAFDRLRSMRYKQLQQEEAQRRRRTPRSSATTKSTTVAGAPLRSMGNQLRAAFDVASGGGSGSGGENGNSLSTPPPAPLQATTQVDAENVALQAELLNMTDQVQHTERTVREIATLNQMFSTAILHQSEQIEKLYGEAVAATTNISRANIQLGKAVKTNKSAQKCMFLLLLMASLGLLFLDWWYS